MKCTKTKKRQWLRGKQSINIAAPICHSNQEEIMKFCGALLCCAGSLIPMAFAFPARAQTESGGIPTSIIVKQDLEQYVKQTLMIKSGELQGTFRLAPEYESRMNWYFCNIGLRPLVSIENKNLIRTYLDQYLKHVNPMTGTIADYRDALYLRTSKGQYDFSKVIEDPVPIHKADSHDAYAATFLSLAVLYRKKTGDTAWWQANVEKMRDIADKTLCKPQKDTGLIPNFVDGGEGTNCYLMDNCEDYRGLADFADVLAADKDRDAPKFAQAAAGVAKGIATNLFDPETKHFRWVVAGGKEKFYPECTAQVFPQLFSVPLGTPEETAQKYNDGWAYLNARGNHWEAGDDNDHSLDGYPWMLLGETAAKRGDREAARVQLAYYQTTLICPVVPPKFRSIQEIGAALRLQQRLAGQLK